MYAPTDKTFQILTSDMKETSMLDLQITFLKVFLAAIWGNKAKICSLEHKIAGLSIWHHNFLGNKLALPLCTLLNNFPAYKISANWDNISCENR